MRVRPVHTPSAPVGALMGAQSKAPATASRQSLSFPGGGVRAFFQFGVADALRNAHGDVFHEYEFFGMVSVSKSSLLRSFPLAFDCVCHSYQALARFSRLFVCGCAGASCGSITAVFLATGVCYRKACVCPYSLLASTAVHFLGSCTTIGLFA